MSYFMHLVLKSSSFFQHTEEYLQKYLGEKKNLWIEGIKMKQKKLVK